MSEIDVNPKNWQTILSLGFSIFGCLYFFIQGLGLGVYWLINLLGSQGGFREAIPYGLLAWSSILACGLLLPVVLLTFFHYQQRPIPNWLDTARPGIRKVVLWSVLVWPIFVLLGWLIAGTPVFAVFLLGPINVIVVGIPILWIFSRVQSGLKGGSQLRQWQIFGFSMAVTPLVIIVLELLALLFLGSILGIWLILKTSMDPSFERNLIFVFNQIALAGEDPERILQLLQPFLLKPEVIYFGLLIFAGIMPMIEEIVKPLALWSLAGRNITPQEGWIGGVLCGAGFALLENLLYFTTVFTADEWMLMAIGRAGTGVLHMLASGLLGWGLAKAWRNRDWLFLGGTFLTAFFLHSIWNTLVLIAGIAPIYVIGLNPEIWQSLLFYLPVIILLILAVAGIILINRFFNQKQNADQAEDLLESAIDSQKEVRGENSF